MLKKIHSNARIIKTARSKEAINQAAVEGLWPLVKPVQPSHEIWSKVLVTQSKITGEIKTEGDFRGGFNREEYEPVTDFIKYYPHEIGNPYAAYLIPSDLNAGDLVYLEDLIEDVRSVIWNQGDSVRLDACHATWNGKDFELDPSDVETAAMNLVMG